MASFSFTFHRHIGQERKGLLHCRTHGTYLLAERSYLEYAGSVNVMEISSLTLFAKVTILEHQPVPVGRSTVMGSELWNLDLCT